MVTRASSIARFSAVNSWLSTAAIGQSRGYAIVLRSMPGHTLPKGEERVLIPLRLSRVLRRKQALA